MTSARIELPYDRGHQWHLVVGTEKAVISERAAMVLIGKFGVAESSGQLKQDACIGTAEEIGDGYSLSKKAITMLRGAQISDDRPRHYWSTASSDAEVGEGCILCGLIRIESHSGPMGGKGWSYYKDGGFVGFRTINDRQFPCTGKL